MLNGNYVIASGLQELFVDKATGLPLANGEVRFYSDSSRSTYKAIFMISGSPPNYTYTQLPNPLTLSAIGTPQDNNGNDIVIYYYPFDANGNVELYFIQVYNSGGQLQWTRQGWPNTTKTQSNALEVFNYIPNGQFKDHNFIPPTDTTVAGQIIQPITYIAPGGYSFERPSGSIATDNVSFVQYNSATTSPTSNPRYAVRVTNTVPGGTDAYKDIRIKFQNVNKFASNTNQFTFSFESQILSGTTLPVTTKLIKYFGNGIAASPPITLILSNITVTTSYQIFSVTFTFGNNTGKNINPLGDDSDYIQLTMSLPTNSSFDIVATNFLLCAGDIEITAFPDTTDGDFTARGVSGWIENLATDGSDMYLPLIRTYQGLRFDTSEIGMLRENFILSDYVNSISQSGPFILANGNGYVTSKYSPLGIPFSRLQNKFWNSTYNIPFAGTGAQFAQCYATNGPAFTIFNNAIGAVSAITDGTSPYGTGFTLNTITTGFSTNEFSVYGSATTIMIKNNVGGVVASATTVGTSGFGAATIQPGYASLDTNVSTATPQIVLYFPAGIASLAGKYIATSSPTANYTIWFTVDGAGSQPTVIGTTYYVQVNLLSTYSVADVCYILTSILAGKQVSTFTPLAASALATTDYFSFFTPNGIEYRPTYIKDGAGTIPSSTPTVVIIPVNILGTDTAAQVGTKTLIAINSYSFATPDLRGVVLIGSNNGAQARDLDYSKRYSQNPILAGDIPGTIQENLILEHQHYVNSQLSFFGSRNADTGVPTLLAGTVGGTPPANQPYNLTTQNHLPDGSSTYDNTAFTGGSQNRVLTISINRAIKY